MKVHLAFAASIALVGLTTIATASPVPLVSGTTVDDADYVAAGVGATDPDWSGTTLGTFSAIANRTSDGFDGTETVADLYNVDATVEATVIRATNGQLVFRYDFGGTDNGGFGAPNGVFGFSLSGFAGYGLTLAFDATGVVDFPYFADFSLSGDGDTLTIDYDDPRDVLGGMLEPILLSVDAPLFSGAGTGSAAIGFDTFSPTDRTLVGALPAPAPIPLPAGAALLFGAMGALAFLRRRAV